MKKLIFALFFAILSLLIMPLSTRAAESSSFCLVYFTGEGCPHCAKVKPLLLEQLPQEFSNLKIIQYEIYQEKTNGVVIDQYSSHYNFEPGIPLLIIDKNRYLQGDTPIINGIGDILSNNQTNPCPMPDGSVVEFEKLELAKLPGKPILISGSGQSSIVTPSNTSEVNLTLAKVISLALVDAVNPCALAVLVMILFAIISLGSKKRSQILHAGLAFCLAVFLMYFIYGLIIVRFFQLVQTLAGIRLWLYKILGIAAIILGILNLKDFFHYRPGGFMTEMPLWLRPKMQRLFFKVTSSRGAFTIGLLVTLFLLPCTIGPYIICGGVLCQLDWLKILPWLGLYNLVFILPMVAITLICYLGIRSTEHIGHWREKNLKYLHLVAGLIIFGLGLAMLLGWA